MVKLLSVSVHLIADVACLKFYFTAKRSATLDTSSRKRGLKLYYRFFIVVLYCFVGYVLSRLSLYAFVGQCV